MRFHSGNFHYLPPGTTKFIEVNINKKDNSNLNEKLPELKNLRNFNFKFIKSEFYNNQSKRHNFKWRQTKW